MLISLGSDLLTGWEYANETALFYPSLDQQGESLSIYQKDANKVELNVSLAKTNLM